MTTIRENATCLYCGEYARDCECITDVSYYLTEAEKCARYLVDNVEKSSGACEDCEKEAPLYYAGTGFVCGACFVKDCEYWENRGGFTTEAILDGAPFNHHMDWEYGGSDHRRVVAHYFATLDKCLTICNDLNNGATSSQTERGN
jgi:hypothetical protein